MDPAAAVDALVERILDEPALWPELLALEDRDRFASVVSGLATDWGIDLASADVRAALVSRRQEWFRRWV